MRKLTFIVLACLLAAPLAARRNDAPKADTEPKATVIVGCKETKLYHRADCKWVKAIDKAGTRVDFTTSSGSTQVFPFPGGKGPPQGGVLRARGASRAYRSVS